MINTPNPKLNINWMDEHAIKELYRATLFVNDGYTGAIMVNPHRAYEIHQESCAFITRIAIERIMRNARQK